jgi:hypothetical protein
MRVGLYDFLIRHFVAVTGVFALLSYGAIYSRANAPSPIRSDGYSYYVYLPSWLLHGDSTLNAVARTMPGGEFPDFTAIRRWPGTDRWVNPHPIGEAVLIAPFFAAAHLVTRLTHATPDGFSFYYQHGAGLAGVVYMLAGLSLVRALLLRHFRPPVVLATLVAMTWGTNLFHYGVYDSVFSHIYSFFLIALLLVLTETWWERPDSGISVALGLTGGVMVLTRHTNALFLMMIPLYGVTTIRAMRTRVAEIGRRWRPVLIAAAVATAAVLPQLMIYKYATGRWFISPYGALEGGFTFGSPHLFDVLFGTEKGLFFWSPILLFAVAGWIVASGWAEMLMWPAAAILSINTFLIASWFDWQFGGSYSHRAFTDGFALVAVFMASGFAWIGQRRQLAPKAAAAVCALLAVSLSVAQMIQYWIGVLPIANTTWDQYRALFLKFQ